MKLHERDFLLYRIITGKLKYKDVVIKSPSLEILYRGSEIYKKFYENSLAEGIMTEQDTVNLLCEQGQWDNEKEKTLNEILPNQIEHWKEELYRTYYQSDKKKTIRKYLETARFELNRLMNLRHSYDHVSCTGVANYAKLQFIIENSTFKGKKKYVWEKHSAYSVMSFYQDNIIKEENIRELSHNHPWYMIWQTGKKIGKIFDKPATKLDFDQQRLIMWSILYDNVNEQSDTPPEDVINDDDALDGWLSIKKKERGENQGVKINENAQEVYIPVSNAEDAVKIDKLNSQYARTIKKQRFNAVQKYGELREQDLPDIKQEIMMEQNRRFRGG
jgi:hypothetical protein